MTEDFGEVLKSERLKRGLRFGALARLLSDDYATPKQISRMAQRLVDVERNGRRDRQLVAQLVRVLQLDPTSVSNILKTEKADDRERWLQWINEPVDPAMHIRAIPGVWITKRLTETSADDPRTVAAEFAREKRLVVCLAVNRSLSIWFDDLGREYARVTTKAEDQPRVHSFIGGHRFVFESTM